MAQPHGAQWRLMAFADPSGDLEYSDRVRLPRELLHALDAQLVSGQAVLLQLGTSTHFSTWLPCSVHEMTAPEGAVHVPSWILDTLDVSEGATVYLRFMRERPVTAEFCRFEVEEDETPDDDHPRFLELPNPRAVLEKALGWYRTLKQGTVIPIQFHQQSYFVKVVDLEPDEVCAISDTDLVVDLVGLKTVEEEKQQPSVVLDEHSLRATVSVASDSWTSVPIILPAVGLGFSITASTALDHSDADFEAYIGDHTCPEPQRLAFTMASQQPYIGFLKLTVPQTQVVTREWYLGLSAFGCEGATVDVVLSIENGSDKLGVPEPDAMKQAQVAVGSPQDAPATPSKVTCPHCKHSIPQESARRHIAFCGRHNTVCHTCDRVVPKACLETHWHCDICMDTTIVCDTQAERDKHMVIWHEPLPCPRCNAQLANLKEHHEHEKNLCPERTVVCRFCYNHTRAGEPPLDHRDRLNGFTQHESECGSKTDECSICGKRIKLKQMEMHLQLHRLREREEAQAAQAAQALHTPQQPSLAAAVDSTRCINSLCCHRTTNALGICRQCMRKLQELSGSREITDTKQLLSATIKAYFTLMTVGCGSSSCTNTHCASSGTEQPSGSTAGAQALQRAVADVKARHISLCEG
eukprot:m.111696 g.111696  ORF g.111696 m.111696 type:complete len:637 (+) comp13455_c0_seq2:264-2174(+)